MSTYLVGDVHGCFNELISLLEKVSFNVGSDVLWLTGDLINRGPYSLEVLRLVISLGDSAKVVLGNHDLNLILLYKNIKKNKKLNTIMKNLLKSEDIHDLIYWLRRQPLLIVDQEKKIIMVHAGIYPFWSIKKSIYYSKKIEMILFNKNYDIFLNTLYSINDIKRDDFYKYSNLSRIKELKDLSFALKVFTRMRYCRPDKNLDMLCKKSPSKDTLPLLPWFSINNESLNDYSVFFGHWASLEEDFLSSNIISLDTGCCWGGTLSMFRLEDKTWFREKYQVNS
ncbi:MAG: symmetrical bis(5'-nucleosyl)-tetraphosphatase [Buchnera aphidicola (Chaetogeoica yunlongensis)]